VCALAKCIDSQASHPRGWRPLTGASRISVGDSRGLALIDLFRSVHVFGKLSYNQGVIVTAPQREQARERASSSYLKAGLLQIIEDETRLVGLDPMVRVYDPIGYIQPTTSVMVATNTGGV
jgi:hypothetical protein